MNDDLEGHIRRTHATLDALRAGMIPEEAGELDAAVEELSTTLEELEVTAEELREQNEELRRTQQELIEQRRSYQELFELAPDAYVVSDTHGVIRDANREAGQLLGVRREALPGRPLATFVPFANRKSFRRELLGLARGEPAHGWDLTLQPEGHPALVVSAEIRPARALDGSVTALRWLLHDVTAARRAQAALQVAFAESVEETEQLRDLDRWKDAFMAAAAHDLRSPLAIIKGASDTLHSHPDLDPERAAQLVDRIRHRADHLDRLLSDLLDLDRFTRGVVTAERRRTDVRLVVDEATTHVDFSDHPLEVDVHDISANLDAPRIGQIVTNLLRNAVEHTPAGTPIRVAASREETDVRLVVEDQGPGVPDKVRQRLFSPFVTQVAHDADAPGTGIGLSLVQLFTELHGGEVRLENRPGGGARFVVELPEA